MGKVRNRTVSWVFCKCLSRILARVHMILLLIFTLQVGMNLVAI